MAVGGQTNYFDHILFRFFAIACSAPVEMLLKLHEASRYECQSKPNEIKGAKVFEQ